MENISIEKKHKDRLEEWKGWLQGFAETLTDDQKTQLELLPNAAELLNDYYWRIARQFIRPLLTDSEDDHNIHYYKIISASELITMAVLPWKYTEAYPHTQEDRAHINARFGLFVGMSIMLNWKINGIEIVSENELGSVMYYKEVIKTNPEGDIAYPYNFMEEHIALLEQLNVNGPLPILSNSQSWRLIYIACTAVRNAGKL